MAKPRTGETICRELKRLRLLRSDRRKHGTSENYQTLLGAEWALQWVLGVPNARAVALIIKDVRKGAAR